MKNTYNVKNTGAQIVNAPKKVNVAALVHGIRGKDVRCGATKNANATKAK